MTYGLLTESIRVLEGGLPDGGSGSLPMSAGALPVAVWRRGDLGAVLHMRRQPDGDREVDLVVLVHAHGEWRFTSGYLGWGERSRRLVPDARRGRDPGSLLDHLGTSEHPPHVGGASRTVYVAEFLAHPEVVAVEVDYRDGLHPQADRWRVGGSGLVLVGFTTVEPAIRARFS